MQEPRDVELTVKPGVESPVDRPVLELIAAPIETGGNNPPVTEQMRAGARFPNHFPAEAAPRAEIFHPDPGATALV